MCPKKTLHGQLTPPSLGGPIRRKTTPYKNDETCQNILTCNQNNKKKTTCAQNNSRHAPTSSNHAPLGSINTRISCMTPTMVAQQI